jgi:ABC-type transporter Mla subunit MlaD
LRSRKLTVVAVVFAAAVVVFVFGVASLSIRHSDTASPAVTVTVTHAASDRGPEARP